MHVAAGDDYRAGITLPGMPGLVMGRSRALASGFTYGFADIVDYFIEEVRDGRVRRDGAQWEPVRSRMEPVKRIGASTLPVHLFETSHGLLERSDPHQAHLADGFYLARAYVGMRAANESHVLEFALQMPQFRDVHAAFEFVAKRHSEVSMYAPHRSQ